jgi:putative transposase
MEPDEVEAIIEDHLMRYYLRRERSSLARVVSEIRSACGERGFEPPTRRTVQRRLDAMDGLARKMWRAPTEEPGGVLWETGTDRRRSFGVKRCGLH